MNIYHRVILPYIGVRGSVKYILLALISSLTNFFFIALVTHTISLLSTGAYSSIKKEYLIAFLAVILFFVWSRKSLAYLTANVSQKIIWDIRKQLIEVTLEAAYPALADKKNLIRASILSDVGALANASLGAIDFFVQLVMSIICLIYLASISVVLFFVTIIISGLGILAYLLTSKKNVEHFKNARKSEDKFQENLNAILDGFKEIVLDPKKGKYIYEKRISVNANESYHHQISAVTSLINNQIIGQVLSYLLMMSILLIFSILLNIKVTEIVGFIFTLMYLLGSITTVMALLPSIMMAKVSAGKIDDLRNELMPTKNGESDFEDKLVEKKFISLETRELVFQYAEDQRNFKVGPINLTVKKGETVFIYGGNGSGKTTLIFSILGLLPATSGKVFLNGRLANTNNPDYKTFFCVVFNDFYLFDRIMGLESVDMNKWNRYLSLFELEDVVSLDNLSFSTTNLSTGQRKRLALVATLLEDKPILVLDEWAADQDPYFRRKFYQDIIPALIIDGYTLIAITHDDKYYHCADKVYRMDDGNLLYESGDNVSVNQYRADQI